MKDCSRNLQEIRSSLVALMLMIQGGIIAALQTLYRRMTQAKCPPEILLKNNYSLVILRTSSSAATFLQYTPGILLELEELGNVEAEARPHHHTLHLLFLADLGLHALLLSLFGADAFVFRVLRVQLLVL